MGRFETHFILNLRYINDVMNPVGTNYNLPDQEGTEDVSITVLEFVKKHRTASPHLPSDWELNPIGLKLWDLSHQRLSIWRTPRNICLECPTPDWRPSPVVLVKNPTWMVILQPRLHCNRCPLLLQFPFQTGIHQPKAKVVQKTFTLLRTMQTNTVSKNLWPKVVVRAISLHLQPK